MRNNISLLLIVCLVILNSCATIVNRPLQQVRIDHDPGISIRVDTSEYIYRESEIYNVYIPKNYKKQNFYFLRSRNEIPLIINDTDTLNIKPHRSPFFFWFGNIYMTMGLGMLVDYPNDKSFEYPAYNYIVKSDEKYRNIRFRPIKEKSAHFSLIIPTVNLFYLQTDSGKAFTASGLGISAQLDYFVNKNSYLSLNLGTTLNMFSPAPDSVYLYSNYFIPFEYYSSSNYLNLRFNKITPRIEYGAGISLATLKWISNNVTSSNDSTNFYNQTSHKSFNVGLSSSISYRLTPSFNIGVQYQPLFYDIKRAEFDYQHFITAQMIWRF
jgi:hypothetical protein